MADTLTLPEGAMLVPVQIEAVGDDFAQVSGAWLQGERIARFLQHADSAWVYAVPGGEEALAIAGALTRELGTPVLGLMPGKRPGWAAGDRATLLPLLPEPVADDMLVGLMVAMEKIGDMGGQPACGGCGGGCGGCSGCHGTNANDGALYTCDGRPCRGSEAAPPEAK